MEGVVAGVPSLADYDVIIDAGGDASDPENAVPFSVNDAGRQDVRAAGQLQLPDRDRASFGTEPKFAAKGVEPDLDGDGKVEFGEALPDADFSSPPRRDFAQHREGARRRRATQWQPTQQDAFTALVVMTPTMSEYFEAWKNSRFVAGARRPRRRSSPPRGSGHRATSSAASS